MNLNKSLNVFFSVDVNYVIHFTVTLTSLLENNTDLDLSVFVLHDIKDDSVLRSIVDSISKNYNVKIYLKELESKVFDDFHVSRYVSKANYFRLLFAEIIPNNIMYGLYIDCDTIITGSLSDLADLSFLNEVTGEEYSILAVKDKNEHIEIGRLSKAGINLERYFNSGVMLVNLKKWRKDQVSDKLMSIGEKHKSILEWYDQDVLNIYFGDNWGNIAETYNKFVDKQTTELPIIIHFSGSSKPWHYLDNHPYKALYWKYKKKTQFKNKKVDQITAKKIVKKYYRKLMQKVNLS